MNRFGFSSKKQDNHRPTNALSSGFNSANINRVSSISKMTRNVSNTPLLGNAYPNQFAPYGSSGSSSLQKYSAGKKINNVPGSSGIPSTAKSANRVMSMGSGSVSSKLRFGVTPQLSSRSSFMQQNQLGSTSRLSRSSMPGRGVGKDNRPLSEPTFHRECQATIFEFLIRIEYPHPLTKQNLVRPSLSDVSRIFEFLFSHFQPDIIIKNGQESTTSIGVVVPKMLAELDYPFQLKKSDLASFSGGRQLGAILDAICFVVGVISYCHNTDPTRFEKNFEFDNKLSTNEINSQLVSIALEQEVDEAANISERLQCYAIQCFGSDEQILEMQSEQEQLNLNLKRLDEEIAEHVELPKKIEALKQQNESYDQYYFELEEKEIDNRKILEELQAETREKEAVLQKVINEQDKLNGQVNSQKDIIMQYRLSVERANQIQEELTQLKNQILQLDEVIFVNSVDENKQRTQNSSFIGELEDVISSLFDSIKSSKINQMYPGFSKSFEEDAEWKRMCVQLKRYKDWNISTDDVCEDMSKEVKEFCQRFQNKFKDFKRTLLKHLSSLEGSGSIELKCQKNELQTLLHKKLQDLSQIKHELDRFIAQKEIEENTEMKRLNEMREEIQLVRKKIIDREKNITISQEKLTLLTNKCDEVRKEIELKRNQFMQSIAKRVNQDQQYIRAIEKDKSETEAMIRKSIQTKRLKLNMLNEYEAKLAKNS